MRQREAHARIREGSRLAEKDPAGYERWETPRGSYWIPAGNGKVLLLLLAQQESGVYRSRDRGVQAGDVVIDCGAHVGLYTLEALQAGASQVVAVEPAPANLECLRRNLSSQIADGRVLVVPQGVWDKQDLLPLYEDPTNSAADGFVVPMVNRRVTHQIPLTTIDLLVHEMGLSRVDLIKMDIKGATERALRGATATIARHRPQVILATEEYADEPKALFELVQNLNSGYQVECGSCSLMPGMTVATDVLLFR